MSIVRSRRGVALVAALTLLTLLGIFVAATVALSVASQRGVRAGQAGATALAAAEFAVATVLGDPIGYSLATLRLGQPARFTVSAPETSTIGANVTVMRLQNGVLWLVADAAIGGPDSAERRVNIVAEFPRVGPLPVSGIEARGDVALAADVSIGADTSGDVDCAARNTASRISVAPGASATVAPGIAVDVSAAAADSNSYFLTTWQRSVLSSGAVVIPRVSGDTTIVGGVFDGILVVDGAVTVTGPWIVNGMVVASGPIRASAGLMVTGALLSAYAGPGRAIDLAGATIRFAPCIVAAALRRVSSPRPVRERAWAELY